MFGDTSTTKASSVPQFPLFLLPSLKIPFRRRQPSQASAASSPSTAASRHSSVASASEPPSLSSSPGSSIDNETLNSSPPVSPTRPASFSFASATTPLPFTPSSPERENSRLSRTAPDTLRCNTCSTDVAFGAQIVSKGFTGRHGRAYLVSAPLAAATPSCPSSPVAAAASPILASRADDVAGNLVNIRVGRPESRQLVTGAHVVADISCAVCGAKLGWKYVDAREQAQKYKVGKFILETQRVVAYRSWEDVPAAAVESGDAMASRHFYTAETTVAAQKKSAVNRRVSGYSSIGEVLEEEEEEEEDDVQEEIVFDSEDEDECEDIFAGTWDAEVVAKRRSRKVRPQKKPVAV